MSTGDEKKRKGLHPFIAVVLMIAVTVVLAGILNVWVMPTVAIVHRYMTIENNYHQGITVLIQEPGSDRRYTIDMDNRETWHKLTLPVEKTCTLPLEVFDIKVYKHQNGQYHDLFLNGTAIYMTGIPMKVSNQVRTVDIYLYMKLSIDDCGKLSFDYSPKDRFRMTIEEFNHTIHLHIKDNSTSEIFKKILVDGVEALKLPSDVRNYTYEYPLYIPSCCDYSDYHITFTFISYIVNTTTGKIYELRNELVIYRGYISHWKNFNATVYFSDRNIVWQV